MHNTLTYLYSELDSVKTSTGKVRTLCGVPSRSAYGEDVRMLVEHCNTEPGRYWVAGPSPAAAVATQTTLVPLVSGAPNSNGNGTDSQHAT